MPDPTPQQLAAIAARGTSVVLSSGAGCGKTFVLTSRYLSHLKHDGVRVGEIVAITFTDRAAREMRGRIRKAVAGELRAHSEVPAWAQHLRDLESAPIQTIHSFCGDLLRQFAVAAGLDPRFEVLEEVLAESLRAEALRDALQALLTSETPAGRDLCELVVLYGWPATVDAVESLLKERDAAAWQRWLVQSPRQIAERWTGPDRQELLPAWVDYLLAASPKIAHLVNLFRGTECRGPLMRSNVAKVLDGLPRLATAPDLAAAVDGLCEAAKVGKEKADAWPDADTYETVKVAMAEFRKDLPEKLALWTEEPEGVEAAALVGQRFVRVALSVAEAYQARKARAGVVDFQDLLVLARDLLKKDKSVCDALRKKFRYLLLDEMQDTDPVQMELVELLCGIGIEHDKLFAVGDAKQCLVAGTAVRTPAGQVPVEAVWVGQPVLAGRGRNLLGTFVVTATHRREFNGVVTRIMTAAGRTLTCTPEHAIFTRLVPDRNAFYVYLMRRGRDYRVGLTRGYRCGADRFVNGLDARCRQEGGDGIWVLHRCSDRRTAQKYEQLFLARYGLPGLCFRAKEYSELDQAAIDWVFAQIPTADRAAALAADEGLDLAAPHHVPVNSIGDVTVTYFGSSGYAGRDYHRVSFETSDPAAGPRLADLGGRPAKATVRTPTRWRVGAMRGSMPEARALAGDVGGRVGVPVVERYAFSDGPRWRTTPATAVFPGLQVLIEQDGRLVADEIVSVSRQPHVGPVYDLTVGEAHNYLADGILVHNSIYRFRGAEVALFERLRAAVRDEGRLSLTRNYRSQPGILHFVNALCGLRFDRYEPLEAHHPAVGEGPCVEFLWSVPAAKPPAARESASEVRAREADAIARRIVELLAAPGARVREEGGPRPVTPGDIVLLFRSMSNVAIYEAALRKHGLDYYLVGGRAFFAQQEVYDLLNLLRALENPDDAVALAGTLRSPFGCLADDALVLLGFHRNGLWAGLNDAETVAGLPDDQRPRAERIRGLQVKWRALKDRLPIARLIGTVFADTGYDAAMQFEFLADRKLANLWKLQDMARSFDRSGLFGLADFIARLSELVTNQPREEQAATQPENADVVKIMSIHQAKGLEFPVVFIPDLAARNLGGRTAAARWDRKLGCLARPPQEDPPLFTDFPHRLGLAAEAVADWREDLRILYVACTRARDLLVLSAGLAERFPDNAPKDRPVPVKAPNSWMLALGERFHLASGECLDGSVAVERRPAVSVRIVEPAVELPKTLARRDDGRPPDLGRWNITPILAKPWPAVVDVAELAGSEAARGFRAALRQWDLTTMPDGPELLVRFARTDWPARLRVAPRLMRGVEFLCPWPGGGDRPALRGTIDFVWKEGDGWHALALDDGASPPLRLLAAWAARQHFGDGLRSATSLDLQAGTAGVLDVGPADLARAGRELDLLLNRRYPSGHGEPGA